MRFGVCAGPEHLGVAAQAGYDYLEPGVTGMLRPEQPQGEVVPPLQGLFAASALRPEAYNLLLPGDLKVVGPDEDPDRQERYLDAALGRVRLLGGEVAVFGSGGARQIPPDWPADEARGQTLAFLGRCAAAARKHGVLVAIEPLNTAECNQINSVAEAVELARAVGRPEALGVLSDLYHVAHDGQGYDETRDAAPWLRHVHVAGQGRRAPQAADHVFLRGFCAVLKEAGYAGRISIEANWEDLPAQAAEALAALRGAWAAA